MVLCGRRNDSDCVVGLYNEAVSGESAVYLNAE